MFLGTQGYIWVLFTVETDAIALCKTNPRKYRYEPVEIDGELGFVFLCLDLVYLCCLASCDGCCGS